MEEDRLAKWLTEQFKSDSSHEEPDLSAVIKEVDQFTIDPIDGERLFQKIEQQRKPKKSSSTRRLTWMSVAASILFVLAIQQLFFEQESKITRSQEIASIGLPDHSRVTLNSNSTIRYDKRFNNRILSLEGEAFFEVKKGSSFMVKTELGDVEVLGTSFNVFSRDSFFIVSCATGKVKVSTPSHSQTLLPGQRVWLTAHQLKMDTIPVYNIKHWMGQESHFSKTPLAVVLSSLSHHYGLSIDSGSIQMQSLEFTGSFVHSDIEKALKMVLVPFNIHYQLNGNELKLSQ